MSTPVNAKQFNAAVLVALKAGKGLSLGRYMGLSTQRREGVSQKTGKKYDMRIVTHVVVVGDEKSAKGVQVEQMMPDGFDLSTVQPPAKMGEYVLLYEDSREVERGHVTIRVEKDGIVAAELPAA